MVHDFRLKKELNLTRDGTTYIQCRHKQQWWLAAVKLILHKNHLLQKVSTKVHKAHAVTILLKQQ